MEGLHGGASVEVWSDPVQPDHRRAGAARDRRGHGARRTALIVALAVVVAALIVWLLAAEILMTFG